MLIDQNKFVAILLLGLVGVAVLLAAYTFHKVRRVHLMSYQISNDITATAVTLYSQLEALYALYTELKLEQGLPPTRGWAASPDFLLLVARHAREARPDIVVECGSGTSTVVLARCMQLNGSGHVYSLDHDAEFAEITRANLTRHGLSDWATVVDAPLRPHQLGAKTWNWYSEENLPDVSIDLLVVDGPPTPIDPLIRYPTGPGLFPRLANGATVFLDDAARDGEQWIVEEWIKEFPAIQRREFYCEKGCISLT